MPALPVGLYSLLLLVIPLSAGALGQAGHTLQGRVAFQNGSQPANPVKITLTFNGMRVYETFTDLSGRFFFTSLRPGNYNLIAEGDGQTFETTTVSADVSALGRAPLNFTQNIQLRPIRGKSVPRADAVSVDAADPATSVKARELYKKGLKSADDNKPDSAIKLFQQAIEDSPGFYLAYLSMGDQYLKLRRFEDAAQAYQKAREIKPDRSEPINGLGATMVQQKKYAEALPLLRRVIELGKQTAATHLYLGLGETMAGQFEAAESNLNRAFEMSKAPLTRIYLANLYELKGEPSKAIDQLQAFLKENPEAPQSAQIRGAIEKLRKKTTEPK